MSSTWQQIPQFSQSFQPTSTTTSTSNMSPLYEDFYLFDQPEIDEPDRVQGHVQAMSSFLEQSDEILCGGASSLQNIEAAAIKDRSEPLPNVYDFSAALESAEWPIQDSVEKDDSSMDDVTTLHGIGDRLDNFDIRSTDSALGEMNSRRSSYQWDEDSVFSDRRYSTDTHGTSCVSPIPIKQNISAMNCNDSGIYSKSFESTGRQSVLKPSPFMGHVDSPEDQFSNTDWVGIAFPPIINPLSTETESMSPPPEFQDLRLFPELPNDGFISRPQSTTPMSTNYLYPDLPNDGSRPRSVATRQATPSVSNRQTISPTGREVINRKILTPMCENPRLSVFHDLFRQVQNRMNDGHIACLRDLEKDLFELGPNSPNCTGPLFLRLFHEFFYRCPKALPSIPESDQCRPTETYQYSNSYYLDTWNQVFRKVYVVFKLKAKESERIVKSMQTESKADGTAGRRAALDPTRGRLKSCPKRGKAPQPVGSLKKQMPGPGPPLGRYSSTKNTQRSACSPSEQTPDQVSATASASTLIAHQPRSTTTTAMLSNYTDSAFPHDGLLINLPLVNDNNVHAQYMMSPSIIYDTVTGTARNEVHTSHQEGRLIYSSVSGIPAGGVGIAGPPLSPGSPSTVDWNNNQSLSPSTSGDQYDHSEGGLLRHSDHEPHVHICQTCNKSYARMCDLRKHGKTHDRPYKCTEQTCYYHSRGFSAEKDRDRHFHDKHERNQKKHQCDWECGYSSTRMSNVKQHMEKTHGYEYVRSKSVKNNKSPSKKAQNQPDKSPLAVQGSPGITKKKSPSIRSPGVHHRSFENTPATLPSNSPLGHESLSPHTMEASPVAAGMFAHLPSPPLPPQGIAPEVIQSITPISHFDSSFDPVPPSSFNDPMGAVNAINRQKHTPESKGLSIMVPQHAFTQNGMDEPFHGDYTQSPDEEFALKQHYANDLLRDAPPELIAAVEDGYPIRYEHFNHELDKEIAR